MDQFIVVVECAIEYQGKFLVIKRPKGVHAADTLAFPGGKVEYQDGTNNKNILTVAIKREIFEEVGLTLVDPIHFVTSSHFVDSNKIPVLFVLFYCKLINTTLNLNVCAEEIPEYYWLNSEEIEKNSASPSWFKDYVRVLMDTLRESK